VIFEIVEAADTKSAAVGQAWNHLFSGKKVRYHPSAPPPAAAYRRHCCCHSLH